MIRKLNDLPKPKCAKDLRTVEGLLLQLNRYSWRRDVILRTLEPWKKAEAKRFQTTEFGRFWECLLRSCQDQLQQLGYWNGSGSLKMVVDASAAGYGAALMDKSGNVVAMMSRRNKKPWAHSSEAELDALPQALRTFRHLALGRQIVVFTDSWASAKMWNWKSQSTLMLRRMEEVLRDYHLVRFQAGSENQLADLLSRQKFLMYDGEDNKCEMESEMEDDHCETASLQESYVYSDEESNESASSSEVCAYPVAAQQELDGQARE